MNAREELEYLHHRTPPLAPHGSRSISGVFPPPATREADLRENGWLLTCTTQHIPLPPRGHGFWFGFHAQRWASPHAPLSLADACLVSPRIPLSAEKLRAPVSLIPFLWCSALIQHRFACLWGGARPRGLQEALWKSPLCPSWDRRKTALDPENFPASPPPLLWQRTAPSWRFCRRTGHSPRLDILPDWTLSLTGFFPTTCFPDERAQRRRKRIQ
jgi:hypothetical protein